MLFNSIAFLVFFPIVCIGYFLLPKLKYKNLFLLAASYYFYMNWKPVYALLLFSSTFITYLAALGIAHFEDQQKKKGCLVISLVLNLAILFFFKYYNFAAENITALLHYSGLAIQLPALNVLLPMGISFFTYALFVSFFPQLVAGPIERSSNLLRQFKSTHTFSYEATMEGARLMVWGFFLKLVLADRCALYVDAVFNNVAHHNGGSFLLASLFFPFQIYGDFAGYSLVAIGCAKIMGFHLMENFHRPYFAVSVTDFWRRWHISLSTWFRDYLYIPLGGNRVGSLRCYRNVLITFVVSGIWHGANWTFVIWGAIHGLFQCVERWLCLNRRQWSGSRKALHIAFTFCVVAFAWIFFRANSLSDAWQILHGIVCNLGMPMVDATTFLGIT